jgi:AraC-like DNA-binding protein
MARILSQLTAGVLCRICLLLILFCSVSLVNWRFDGRMVHFGLMKPIFGKIENPDHSFLLVKRTDKPRPEFLWHFHHAFELNLVVKGAGTRFIGDHIGHFNAGDTVLMGAELPHTWCSDPALPRRRGVYQSIAIQFGDCFIGDSLLDDPEWRHIRLLMKRATRGLSFRGKTRETARKKILELTELSGPAKLSCFLGILDALAQSNEYQFLASQDFAPALPQENETRIDQVCTWINRHYAEEITLSEAAALINMSVSAFSRFFKRAMGKSFTDYVTELRLSHACKLMLETDVSISEAAFQSGFNNLSNFNRRFLERKNVSPRAFRQSYRSA